jgi:hypothetical protein
MNRYRSKATYRIIYRIMFSLRVLDKDVHSWDNSDIIHAYIKRTKVFCLFENGEHYFYDAYATGTESRH